MAVTCQIRHEHSAKGKLKRMTAQNQKREEKQSSCLVGVDEFDGFCKVEYNQVFVCMFLSVSVDRLMG